jgi:hypothetical protein
MDAMIPIDRGSYPQLSDDEIERLLALEDACACMLAYMEEQSDTRPDDASAASPPLAA